MDSPLERHRKMHGQFGRRLRQIFRPSLILVILALVTLGILFFREVEYSAFQAVYLSRLAKDLRWTMESGPNPDLPFPQAGPYEERLGYKRANSSCVMFKRRRNS